MKIIVLHGRTFILFSQLVFFISTRFQCAYNVKKIFLNCSRQRFKKAKRGFLFSGISPVILFLSFYISLFIFEEIFCWIAWVTFRWIVVLFSYCFNFHKTNYACKECKKELKISHWLNNVCLQSIFRLDWCASLNKERQRKSFAKLKQISSQNLVKTLCILHKMICKPKKFFTCGGPFANRFCFTNSNPELVWQKNPKAALHYF